MIGNVFAAYLYFNAPGNYAHNIISYLVDFGIFGLLMILQFFYVFSYIHINSINKITAVYKFEILIIIILNILLFKSRSWNTLYFIIGYYSAIYISIKNNFKLSYE